MTVQNPRWPKLGWDKGKGVRNHAQNIYIVFEIKAIVGISKSGGGGARLEEDQGIGLVQGGGGMMYHR